MFLKEKKRKKREIKKKKNSTTSKCTKCNKKLNFLLILWKTIEKQNVENDIRSGAKSTNTCDVMMTIYEQYMLRIFFLHTSTKPRKFLFKNFITVRRNKNPIKIFFTTNLINLSKSSLSDWFDLTLPFDSLFSQQTR